MIKGFVLASCLLPLMISEMSGKQISDGDGDRWKNCLSCFTFLLISFLFYHFCRLGRFRSVQGLLAWCYWHIL